MYGACRTATFGRSNANLWIGDGTHRIAVITTFRRRIKAATFHAIKIRCTVSVFLVARKNAIGAVRPERISKFVP